MADDPSFEAGASRSAASDDGPRGGQKGGGSAGEAPIVDTDVLIVGAGAAGLMAAIAARGAIDARGTPGPPSADAPRVLVIDGSARIGLKILVSGGGRCNVTNEAVEEADFDTDAPKIVRGALRELPPAAVRAFLERRGCALYAEPLGKLFPRSDRARDVLDTLVAAARDSGATIEAGRHVVGVAPGESAVDVDTDAGLVRASRVIVATGGRSLPRTGSRGFGLDLAAHLGHDLDLPLPALTPLRLAPDGPLAGLAGVTIPALLSVVPQGTPPEQAESARFRPISRAGGSLLVTHDGASGPAALDVSGACALGLSRGDAITLEADFVTLTLDGGPWAPFRDLPKPPGACLPPSATPPPATLEAFTRAFGAARSAAPRRSIAGLFAERLPRSLTAALLRAGGVDPAREVGALSDRDWRAVHRALSHADLRVRGTEGYGRAEVTRGGVRLRELHRATLESRRAPRVHFCGEVCSATGRLGGFNFQWAWSSGFVAGRGAAAAARAERTASRDAGATSVRGDGPCAS